MKTTMIAPCGMNCAICLGHLREKNQCAGCRNLGGDGPGACRACIIRTCEHIRKSKNAFCHTCPKYPCRRLKQLDKRYRGKYGMSMLENLETIREVGIRRFTAQAEKQWQCARCGALLCVHRPACPQCGATREIRRYS